jgi:hypothetical protein
VKKYLLFFVLIFWAASAVSAATDQASVADLEMLYRLLVEFKDETDACEKNSNKSVTMSLF